MQFVLVGDPIHRAKSGRPYLRRAPLRGEHIVEMVFGQEDLVKVLSNGIRIHVEKMGSGDVALVFLHFWGGSARTWRHVTGPLSASFQTIATDHRGWGESDAPADGYTLDDLAADALGVIEALGVERYVLIGHSMGGKVAQLLASRHPKGLLGLVLVAPAPPSPMHLPTEVRQGMVAAYSSRETIEVTIDQVLAGKPLSAEDRAQAIADILRGASSAKAAWPTSTSQEDISAAVAAIKVPTLVIAGELDNVDTVDTLRSELLSRIPHAVLEVLPQTGHLSPLESPVEIVDFIEEFMGPLDQYWLRSNRQIRSKPMQLIAKIKLESD